MKNMNGCKEYWKGYRAGKSYISIYGIETTIEHYTFGYCGNGTLNYCKGFSEAIRKASERLAK